jgi:hypothetical protein
MLKPNQVGLLAAFVKQAIDAFPLTPSKEPVAEPPDGSMDDWEEELKRLVDGSPGLPDFENLEEKDANLMDYLIDYFQ